MKYFIVFFISITFQLRAQSPLFWTTIQNPSTQTSRYNDAWFVSPNTGWVCNGVGQVFKTINGGSTWNKQIDNNKSHFRSIVFFDSLNGWVGNVGPGEFGATDSIPLYNTSDGGYTWQPLQAFQGIYPKGVCGMYKVNDSVIVAVGRIRGPAVFLKTTNRGKTWVAKDLNYLVAGLIDVHFWTPDSGIAVGLTNVLHDSSSAVVIETSDGGNSWKINYTTSRKGEHCWKISFPTKNVGYVALQRNSKTPIYFLKTTDRGKTWTDKLFSSSYYFVQGIGFLNDSVGWYGGYSSQTTFKTTDGGNSWSNAGFGYQINRFRFINDTLGYASGRTIYKLSPTQSVGILPSVTDVPQYFDIEQNYPNPFNPSTIIEYNLLTRSKVEIDVYDLLGRHIKNLNNQIETSGKHSISFLAQGVPSGIYFYKLHARPLENAGNDFIEIKKMVLLK
ncbi:MAG: T9SS type A sorting domain-containing protein [Bacteroidetes bacterium]|nr:T9SS type A sorting domain-containing protein [Bacteroidota bacterium]